MASKFSQFLQDNKIDTRRLLVASRHSERLRPEDRRLRQARERAKVGAQGSELGKPRSGRAVTRRLLASATMGKPIPGAAKTRLLRAVNRVLEQKKKPSVELKALF